jgi:hypothetical protein
MDDVLRAVFGIDLRVVLACVLLLCVVALYVVVPVLVRFTQKHAAQPQYVTFSLDDVTLPREVARDFDALIDRLKPAGFEPVAVIARPRALQNIHTVQLYLANRRDKVVAGATTFYVTKDGVTRRALFYVWITTRFRDGTVLALNNSRQIGSFPPRPGLTTEWLPSVRDPARLYRLHREMVARSGLRDKAFPLDEEFGGDAAAYQATTSAGELDHAARAGYMELSSDGETYRPTWKGAFLMTWKLLWPANLMLRAARDRRARRLLAELEGDQGSERDVVRLG